MPALTVTITHHAHGLTFSFEVPFLATIPDVPSLDPRLHRALHDPEQTFSRRIDRLSIAFAESGVPMTRYKPLVHGRALVMLESMNSVPESEENCQIIETIKTVTGVRDVEFRLLEAVG